MKFLRQSFNKSEPEQDRHTDTDRQTRANAIPRRNRRWQL